ncbi:unnamed protein product [Gadus morhua 'NCC']
MASCLVPDFPAVMMALQHLGELERQFKEEKMPFNTEASHHLKEIAAAVTKLETSRRSVHEQLEVETIENGKVRHQIHKFQEKISKDIMADVTAARESNAKEIADLHAELNRTADLQRATTDRQEEILRQNRLLVPERDQVRAKHDNDTAVLNHRISLKHSAQAQLQRSLDKVAELRGCIAAAEESKSSLERDMARESAAFDDTKDGLMVELDQVANSVLKQKQENARRQKKLSHFNNLRMDRDDQLADLTQHGANLERTVERLTASRGLHEVQLKEAVAGHQEAGHQVESAERELCELRRHYEATGQRLQEDLVLLDQEIEEGTAAGVVYRRTLAAAEERAKVQRREENEMRAVHLTVSERLESTTRRLDEQLASITRHGAQACVMEVQTGRLLESNLLNVGLYQEYQEKARGRLGTEQWNLGEAEVEKREQGILQEEARKAQEAHVDKATAAIRVAREKHGSLCLEEVAMRRELASNAEADALTRRLTGAEVDFVQMETEYREAVERLAGETEQLQRETEAKERQLEEGEAALSQAEARHLREEASFRGLERLIAGQYGEKARLEGSTKELRGETAVLLGPRDEVKAGLEAGRARHRELMVGQASELLAVEARIQDGGRRLETVSLENSRLRLSVLKMEEDMASARSATERHGRAIVARREQEQAAWARLLPAWGEDEAVTREGCDGYRPLVAAFGALLGRLGTRSAQFEGIAERVRQQLLHISKLGY